VLASPHRLRRSADFSAVLRRGVRARRTALVVHLLLTDGEAGAEPHPDPVPAPTPARVGFVVSRAVGGSVVRHQVTRRLRALTAARIDRLPAGSRCVVRALPTAADRSSGDLARDLDGALSTALDRGGAR
jgi:ribonuclease P protein component